MRVFRLGKDCQRNTETNEPTVFFLLNRNPVSLDRRSPKPNKVNEQSANDWLAPRPPVVKKPFQRGYSFWLSEREGNIIEHTSIRLSLLTDLMF